MDNNSNKLSLDIRFRDLLRMSVQEQYNFFIFVLATFFDYLLIPRNGYIEISESSVKSKYISKPKLTKIMVNYVIKNILGIDMVNFPTMNHSEYINILKTNNEIEIDFANKLSSYSQKVLKEIYPKDENISIIADNAFSEINVFIDYIFNTYIATDGELTIEIIEQNIYNWTHRKGDNVFLPIDYKFNNDVYNNMLQSFIWLLCGLNDWLEKDIIEESDVTTACKILFYNFEDFYNSKLLLKISNKSMPQYVISSSFISSALFKHDFYISISALNLLTQIFVNLIAQYQKDVLTFDKKEVEKEKFEQMMDKLEEEGKIDKNNIQYLYREHKQFVKDDIYDRIMSYSKQI
jgi:hypothetical protein